VTQAQVPSYLSVLTTLTRGPDRPRTAVICHTALPAAGRGEQGLTRTLLARAGTVIVHSAAQAAQARVLAPDVPIVIARMPPPPPRSRPASALRIPNRTGRRICTPSGSHREWQDLAEGWRACHSSGRLVPGTL
jgi:hypothetical protein